MKFQVMLFLIVAHIFADRGMVTFCGNDHHAEFLRRHLCYLRKHLQCQLPVEVWHVAGELSEGVSKKLLDIDGVAVKTLHCEWKVKIELLQVTQFDEAIFIDPDVIFFENPEQLFANPHYVETGAFFFQDRRTRQLKSEDSYYKDWQAFLLRELPNFVFSKSMEGGCIVMDRIRHRLGIAEIMRANREEIYQYLQGDKETYWFGLEKAKEPYFMNDEVPMGYYGSGQRYIHMMQFLEGRLFYQEGEPIKPRKDSYFHEEWLGSRRLTKEEIKKIGHVCINF